MANIKLTLPAEPFSGQIVSFPAPCDCDKVTDGLIINGETYTICDAMGNKVTGTGGVWCSGAQVSVVLDCENKKAYLQNGNTTPAMIGAASEAEHAVKHYDDLSDIGLSDADMSATDVVANFATIYGAMPVRSELWELFHTSSGNCPNLYASLNAKLNTDLGVSQTSALIVRFVKRSYVLEIYVISQSTSASLTGVEFSCVYRHATSPVLTTFSITRNPSGFVSKAGDYLSGGYLGLAGGKTQWVNNANGYLQLTNYTVAKDGTNAAHLMLAHPKHSSCGGLDKILRLAYRKDGGAESYYPILHTGNIESLYPTAKVVTGSYTGTGTYGKSNPNTIVCGFEPKLFVVCKENANTSYSGGSVWVRGVPTGLGGDTQVSPENLTWGEDGLSWYNDYDAERQLNTSDETYYWCAIG